jgi:hypothetical protein
MDLQAYPTLHVTCYIDAPIAAGNRMLLTIALRQMLTFDNI